MVGQAEERFVYRGKRWRGASEQEVLDGVLFLRSCMRAAVLQNRRTFKNSGCHACNNFWLCAQDAWARVPKKISVGNKGAGAVGAEIQPLGRARRHYAARESVSILQVARREPIEKRCGKYRQQGDWRGAQGIAAESPQDLRRQIRGLGAESPVFLPAHRAKKCAQNFVNWQGP
jgi:hypothetical protein